MMPPLPKQVIWRESGHGAPKIAVATPFKGRVANLANHKLPMALQIYGRTGPRVLHSFQAVQIKSWGPGPKASG